VKEYPFVLSPLARFRGYRRRIHVSVQLCFLSWFVLVSVGCAQPDMGVTVAHAEVIEELALVSIDPGNPLVSPVTQVEIEAFAAQPPVVAAVSTAGEESAASRTESATTPDGLETLPDPLAALRDLAGEGVNAQEENDDPLDVLGNTINILVLGSDRRPRMPNWRTDVIMIVVMDLDAGQAGVISIPRDVYIDVIPGHRPNRINVIDYLGEQDEPDGGGPALLAEILEEKMGIPIHHYLRFDFEGFKKVVDALGGLEIMVDCPVYDYLPEEDISLALRPGLQRLDGKQALGYVRSRRQGGDLERSRRQQRVIWAVRDQIRNENLITRVPALYAALHDSVQTDIGLVAAIRYVRFALSLKEENVHGLVLTSPDLLRAGWRGGMSVFVADWPLITTQIQKIFDRPPFEESNTVGETGDRVRCP
jgi:polyisoprenyl-teichoic acid--peptidoglycan teichoic acid transferase